MNGNNEGEILIYQTEDGSAVTEVRLEAETVWLTQAQMVALFGRDQSVISRHIGNVFREAELLRESNMQKMHIANSDKPVDFYSLDVIISVGYRVKSKQGTRFRQWANQVLKEYLTRGYALNEKKLQEQNQKLSDLRNTVALLEQTLAHQAVGEDEAKGLLKVIADYAYALTTLDRFDHESLEIESTSGASTAFFLDYD